MQQTRIQVAIAILALACGACAASRKVSAVEVRAPASVAAEEADAMDRLRERLAQVSSREGCPAPFTSAIRAMAQQKVQQPTCPADLQQRVHLALNLLRLEERSLLDEILSSQCQKIIQGENDDRFQSFLKTYDTTGPLGRRKEARETSSGDDQDFTALTRLRDALRNVETVHLALEQWIEAHGAYLLPEDSLNFFRDVVLQQRCQLNDQHFQESYRVLDVLEDLERLLGENAQAAHVHGLTRALKSISEQKVTEYFYPQPRKIQ